MIDKIKIYTDDFQIEDKNPLKISQIIDPEIDVGEEKMFLFRTKSGREIFGRKAFFNSENWTVEVSYKGLFVDFNPSRFSPKNAELKNFYSADFDDTLLACQNIQQSLSENGIMVDLLNMNLSRIDLAKTRKTTYNIGVYSDVFSSLQAKRMDQLRVRNTFYYMNKSREFIFYDKISDTKNYLKKQKIDYKKFPELSENFTRGEIRLKKKKVIENNLNLFKLQDLLNFENFDQLDDQYREMMRDIVFRKKNNPDDQSLLEYATTVEMLKYLKKNFSRNTVSRMSMLLYVQELDPKKNQISKLKDAMSQAGFSRSHIWKTISELQESQKIYHQIKNDLAQKIDFQSLYSELFEKFCE